MIIEDYTADVFPSLNKDMQKHDLFKLKDQPDISQLESSKPPPIDLLGFVSE